MKYRLLAITFGVFILAFQSCQPLTSLQIETIIPADIDFPGSFNKAVFINLATDINHDEETDTLLYNIILNETLSHIDEIKIIAEFCNSNKIEFIILGATPYELT